ncbi:MAG: MotA/TolQ/ExbB proton channel family protein [Pseudomonadota bacterium]
MIETRRNFSRRILFRLLVLGVIVAVILFMSYGYINDLYLENQLTPVGLVINGGILLAFLLGLIKVISSLWYYMGEESALARFVRQFNNDSGKLLKGIDSESIIARRYNIIRKLSERHVRINHGALASTLLADESTRTSFARYIGNILILTGVFGTIVSLSVALVGASSLLETVQDTGSMGLVIHGMSTALSTTITAILCYLFYGYFNLKLGDAQTHLLSGVEEATTVYLLPKYARDSESMLQEVSGLIHGLREAAGAMLAIQQEYAQAGSRLNEVAVELGQQMGGTKETIDSIKQLLRDGFRLPAAGE